MKIEAYLVNNYYIFTNYNDLSSHIHDVVHFTNSVLPTRSNSFSIIKGEFYLDRKIFVSDHGVETPVICEQEEDLYYV